MTDKSTPKQAGTSLERPSLQFRGEADIERRPFEGRTENLGSGRATRFHSVEELLAFFASLRTAQDPKQDPKAVKDKHDT